MSAADIRALCAAAVQSCLSQREEILSAFIAKYGFHPEMAVQVEQRQADGTSTWRIELNQPEGEGPAAWMYLGEPYYDGRHWHDQWQVTLDERLARYKSGNKEPIPLWAYPAAPPQAGGLPMR